MEFFWLIVGSVLIGIIITTIGLFISARHEYNEESDT